QRNIEPVGDVRSLAQRRSPSSITRKRLLRFNPVALAFEWIGGKREAKTPLLTIEVGPVNPDSCKPEFTQDIDQKSLIGIAVTRVAHAGEHDLRGRFIRLLLGKRGQGLAGSNLQ